jgi:hypothetical protein
MHTVKLNITDEIYEKFMGLVDILPKGSIEIEEIDSVPFYPAITFEEAKRKVEAALKDVSKNGGKDVDEVFSEILS